MSMTMPRRFDMYGDMFRSWGMPSWMGGARQPTPQPTAPPATLSPMQGFFPSPSQLAQFMPRPYQEFGGVPRVDPAYYNAAHVDPAAVPGYISAYSSLLGSSLAPLFGQQRDMLNQDLASRGIFNSGAASQLMGNLEGQQAGQFAGAISPLIQEGMGFAQQDAILNAQMRQEADAANAAAANQANLANAGFYSDVVRGNEAQYNAFLQELLQGGMGIGGSLLGSYLSSFGASPAAIGILGTGAAGAGSAYTGAYQAGMSGVPTISSALGGALASFAPQPKIQTQASPTQAPGY